MSSCRLIPRDMTAEVGRTSDTTGRYYLLWKNSQTIVIQASPIAPSPDPCGDILNYHKQVMNGMEIIQTLLSNIKFGFTNWAYLVRQGENNYILVFKQRFVRRISCRIYAPLVLESELEITQWITFHRRNAIWKGREVDVCMATNDSRAQFIESETNGREILLDLDLTFEVLGHIIRDGDVVGIMLEAGYGRPLRLSDRAIMYEAVAKLQSRNIYFPSISKSNIIIHHGKVRFMNVGGTARIRNDGQGPTEELAKTQHWKLLNALFDTLETCDFICPEYRRMDQHFFIIPPLPTPDRPFPSVFDIIMQSKAYFISNDAAFSSDAKLSKRRAKGGSKRKNLRLITATEPLPLNGRHSYVAVDDPPLCKREAVYPYPRLVRWPHPSGRVMRPKTRLLIAPDENENIPEQNEVRSFIVKLLSFH
jgi:hypothetical protein